MGFNIRKILHLAFPALCVFADGKTIIYISIKV